MISRIFYPSILIGIVIICTCPALQAQNVMVTPESYFENKNGEEITYQEFVKRMDSGKYMPLPIMDEDGNQIGFRLASNNEGNPDIQHEKTDQIRVESTEINQTETVPFIYRDYLFVLVEFQNGDLRSKKWMVLDTGTLIPVILLPEVAAEVSPVDTVRFGNIEVFNPPIGSFEFNDLIRNLNRYRDRYPDEFGEFEIGGILGLPLISNYLTSLDLQAGSMILRPLDSHRRTFKAVPPYASVSYQLIQGNIWFSVSVNGQQVKAHLDTGNPYLDLDSSLIGEEEGVISSLLLNKIELSSIYEISEYRVTDFGHRYQSVPIDVRAVFGNHAIEPFIVTIDPQEQQIIFESR